MACALDPMAVLSCSDFTGPRSVTSPFTLMILTFRAIVESDLSLTIDLRIRVVSAISPLELDWEPAVTALLARSRVLIPEFSGEVAVGIAVGLCAKALHHAPQAMNDSAKNSILLSIMILRVVVRRFTADV